MTLPIERALHRIERRWRRNGALHRLWDLGPAAVYAGLLHYASGRTKPNGEPWNAAGWSKHAFTEIYGRPPRPQDRTGESDPLADLVVERWAAQRKRKPRRRVQP